VGSLVPGGEWCFHDINHSKNIVRDRSTTVYADIYANDSVLHRRTSFGTSRSILITAGRTVVESALISWAGVFVMFLIDYCPNVGVSLVRDVVKIISFRPVVRNAYGVGIRGLRAIGMAIRHCRIRYTTCSRRIFASDLC
jgi:hypothetical protein